jgi:hypothetical protein
VVAWTDGLRILLLGGFKFGQGLIVLEIVEMFEAAGGGGVLGNSRGQKN